jgi:cobyrinic acid a,c-diamide synthase
LHPAIEPPEGREVRIAVVQDAAFSFYYQENFEALSRAGATLVFISALRSAEVPGDVDAVYIGGGFPEVHAATLEANAGFLHSLADAAARGLPVYAECGGLMLLSRSIRWQGRGFQMAGVLPVDIDVDSAPQGHGYVEMTVDSPKPFCAVMSSITRASRPHRQMQARHFQGNPRCRARSRRQPCVR